MKTREKEVFEKLSALRGSKTVILGMGNTLKGDDGLGCIVCERLFGKLTAELIDAGTVPENYIQAIIRKKPQNLLIIDAVDFKAKPGTIELFKPEQLDSFVISTHTLSPRVFIEMISRYIDVNVFLVGVQPARMELGEEVSRPVSRAISLLEKILSEIFSKERKIQRGAGNCRGQN